MNVLALDAIRARDFHRHIPAEKAEALEVVAALFDADPPSGRGGGN